MSKAKPMGFWTRSLNYHRQGKGRVFLTPKQHRRLIKKANTWSARLAREDELARPVQV